MRYQGCGGRSATDHASGDPTSGGATKSPTRVDPRRARTRAALIAAGQQLLAERRLDASIQQITDTAGVGFGSFFNHFTDKAELWTAALAETLRAHGDIASTLTDGMDDPAEVVCVGMRLAGRMQHTYPQLARVLLNTGPAAVMAQESGLIDHVRKDITAAVDSARFDIDVEFAVHITAGAMLGLTALLDANPGLDADALADEYAVRMLRAYGLSKTEATQVASRPLPDLPSLA